MGEKVVVDLSRPTGNFWIDNGLVVLYRLFGAGEFDCEEVLEKLVETLVEETGNLGEYFDLQTREIKTYPKKNWKYPSNLFIKATPKAQKTKIDGKDYFLAPPKYELGFSFSRKKEYCDICVRLAPLVKAKMWNYPFVVEPGKFANFYPGLKRELKLCPTCAVAGLAGYVGWLWRAQGRDALHIFCFHGDLKDLERLYREVLDPIRLEEGGGNVPLAFYGPYLHETAWGLLLRLFSYVRHHSEKEKLSPEASQLLARLFGVSEKASFTPLVLYVITGKPSKAFDMQSFKEISHLASLYRLYEHWIEIFKEDPKPQEILENVFRQFQRREGNTYNTIWRERISAAVLNFEDPLPSIEEFLFQRDSNPLRKGSLKVFELYVKEVLAMEANLLSVIKGFGYSLGSTAQKENEMGLLYALRNAKNLDEFFRVLNDVQYRLGLTVPESLLEVEPGESIKGSPWKRVKTLLSIYAMNAFLRAQNKEESKEGENE